MSSPASRSARGSQSALTLFVPQPNSGWVVDVAFSSSASQQTVWEHDILNPFLSFQYRTCSVKNVRVVRSKILRKESSCKKSCTAVMKQHSLRRFWSLVQNQSKAHEGTRITPDFICIRCCYSRTLRLAPHRGGLFRPPEKILPYIPLVGPFSWAQNA
jgi:hypothetical protein